MNRVDSRPTRGQDGNREGPWLGRLVAWFVVGSSLFAAGAPWLDAALAQLGTHTGLRWLFGGVTLVLVAAVTLRLAIALARKRIPPRQGAVAGKDA